MRSWLLHARESFWFLPALFGVGAVLLALGLVEIDRLLLQAGVNDIPLVEDLSATGGRAILSAIGGTMLGVAATSFSITISVLATTSSAYGPRLVRNFMADRGNQLVLATLTSTFLYSLIVLRAVHTEEDASLAFVPVIAVSFAVVLAVADVAVLVYFIHHIAMSVQVTTLQQRVLNEFETVIDRIVPTGQEAEGEPNADSERDAALAVSRTPDPREGTSYGARRTGYIEQLALERLVELASAYDVVLRMLAMPGDHVLSGDPIVVAWATGSLTPAAERASTFEKDLLAAIVIADARSPYQDLRYAGQQVIEIGVRGLTSGTNDPYTAVGAVHALTGALVTLSSRSRPRSAYRDESGVTRLVCSWPRAAELIDSTFLAVRTYGMDHPVVVRAAVDLAQRLETVVQNEDRRALAAQVGAFARAFDSAPREAVDSLGITAALDTLGARLAAARSAP